MLKSSIILSGERRLFRECLKNLIASSTLEVIGEASSAIEALALMRKGECKPNLMICYASTSNLAEFDAIKELASEYPEVETVILTDHVNRTGLDLAAATGAKAFLSYNISLETLRALLDFIQLEKNIFVAPAISEYSRCRPTRPRDHDGRGTGCTFP